MTVNGNKSLDFRFNGGYTSNGLTNSFRNAWNQGRNQGNSNANANGGEAAMGSIVPHAALSCSVKPTPSKEFCYGWMWSKGPQQDLAQTNGWTGVNVVNTSSAGDLYPVDATPGAGTLVAYSLRGFLCLHTPYLNKNAPSGSCGTTIGMVAKFPHAGTGEDQDWTESTTGSLSCSYNHGQSGHDPFLYPNNTAYMSRIAGYSIQLSNARFPGEQTPGSAGEIGSPAGNVRLVFVAPKYKDIAYDRDTASNFKVQVCAGSYTYNTWYHIRMDVIPNSGFDTIKIYSAPINAALGSESWSLLNTISISDTSAYYIDWSSSGHEYKSNGVGFFTQYTQRVTGSDCTAGGSTLGSAGHHERLADALIDKFEFFTKDISG